MNIEILGTNKVATETRQTATGMIAKINGFWYSVNGNEKLIIDVRFRLSPQPE